jgi:hypothetical protein
MEMHLKSDDACCENTIHLVPLAASAQNTTFGGPWLVIARGVRGGVRFLSRPHTHSNAGHFVKAGPLRSQSLHAS